MKPCRPSLWGNLSRCGVLLAILAGWGGVGWCETAEQSATTIRHEIALVDSLLAVEAPVEALARVRRLWNQAAADPVYRWSVESRLGVALSATGADLEALPHLENAVRHDPDDANHHRNLATALVRLNRRGRALSEYGFATELAPYDAALWREYGQVLLDFGALDRADGALHTAAELCGGCAAVDGPLAELYLRQGRAAAAVPFLYRLQEGEPTGVNRRRLLVALSRAGLDSQLVHFLTPTPAAARSAEEWRLLLAAEGRLGQAVQSTTLVGLLEAGGLPLAVKGDDNIWGQAALNLLGAGDGIRGLAAVDRAIAVAPEKVVHHNNRVVLLTRLGRDAEARQEWALVLRLDPGLAP